MRSYYLQRAFLYQGVLPGRGFTTKSLVLIIRAVTYNGLEWDNHTAYNELQCIYGVIISFRIKGILNKLVSWSRSNH